MPDRLESMTITGETKTSRSRWATFKPQEVQDALFAESPPVLSLVTKMIPDFGLERLASRSVAWWAMSEVLPDTHNKVWLNNDQLRINYIHNNREAHDRLVDR